MSEVIIKNFQFLIKGYTTSSSKPNSKSRSFNSSLKDTSPDHETIHLEVGFQFLIKGYDQSETASERLLDDDFQFLIKGYQPTLTF